MAISRDIGFDSYCDSVYRELSGMKSRLLGFIRDIELMEGTKRQTLQPHIQHFHDIIETIDWKLEILTKVCPFDWVGRSDESDENERTASIRVHEEQPEQDLIAGLYRG
ncbi:MAG TPA: hypothetical protein DCP92_24505 [Nitrospiraceae bacterium]|jgi:hypothetical protein|nr:hypothetical protein [Nitrospiraceae bacterium]